MECSPEGQWTLTVGFVGYALFEYWIGKTKRTRANSTVELIIILTMAVVAMIAKLKGNKNV